jgi:hypothetical protein
MDHLGIVLHKFDDLGPRQLQTRWTLRLRAKMLPWRYNTHRGHREGHRGVACVWGVAWVGCVMWVVWCDLS